MKSGKNCEGYPDPTAETAIGLASKTKKPPADKDPEAEKRIRTMMAAIKAMAAGFGYDITNRITFRDKYTGKEYK